MAVVYKELSVMIGTRKEAFPSEMSLILDGDNE